MTLQEKFNTPELRRQLCANFCQHLKDGYSIDSFSQASFKTIQRYIADYGDEIIDDTSQQSFRDAIESARAEGLQFWEKLAIDNAKGDIEGDKTIIIFNLKNKGRYYDKRESRNAEYQLDYSLSAAQRLEKLNKARALGEIDSQQYKDLINGLTLEVDLIEVSELINEFQSLKQKFDEMQHTLKAGYSPILEDIANES